MSEYPCYKITSVADLVPYARNSRTHSARQVDKIAAQKLGLSSLPVIEASHLSDVQRRAYVIVDNRLALDAGWDDEMLRIELRDLDDSGFDGNIT